MRWFSRLRRTRPARREIRPYEAFDPAMLPSRYVDLDRDAVLLSNQHDATSIYFNLSLAYGAVVMNMDRTGRWTVRVKGQGEWVGASQWEALTAARDDLARRREHDG